jgi:hypothetical protein
MSDQRHGDDGRRPRHDDDDDNDHKHDQDEERHNWGGDDEALPDAEETLPDP